MLLTITSIKILELVQKDFFSFKVTLFEIFLALGHSLQWLALHRYVLERGKGYWTKDYKRTNLYIFFLNCRLYLFQCVLSSNIHNVVCLWTHTLCKIIFPANKAVHLLCTTDQVNKSTSEWLVTLHLSYKAWYSKKKRENRRKSDTTFCTVKERC